MRSSDRSLLRLLERLDTAGLSGLMPTLLDWLRARHGLSLLWATTAYLVGLFVAILGWWRRPG